MKYLDYILMFKFYFSANETPKPFLNDVWISQGVKIEEKIFSSSNFQKFSLNISSDLFSLNKIFFEIETILFNFLKIEYFEETERNYENQNRKN